MSKRGPLIGVSVAIDNGTVVVGAAGDVDEEWDDWRRQIVVKASAGRSLDLAYEQAMMSPEAFWGGVAGFGRAFGCDGAWD